MKKSTEKKPRKPVNKMSAKRLAQLKARGVTRPFSSITSAPTRLRSSGKPIRKVNPIASAKRNAQRKKNHAEYRKSATYKLVTARAAGRCEGSLKWRRARNGVIELLDIRDGMEWQAYGEYVRCVETERLSHHHVRYPDEPGTEQPEDIMVGCKRCHEWIETVHHPTRRNGR